MKNFTRFTLAILLSMSLNLVKGSFATSEFLLDKVSSPLSNNFDKANNEFWIDKTDGSESLMSLSNTNYVVATENSIYNNKLNLSLNKIYNSAINDFSLSASFVIPLSINPSSLNFGVVEIGQTASGIIQFHNNSGKDVEVSVVSNNSNTVASPSAFLISSGTYQNVAISMNVLLEGLNSVIVTFNTSSQTYPQFNANITATGYFPAKISVSPNEFYTTVESGKTLTKDFSISNSGTGLLNYSISYTSDHTSIPSGTKAGLYAGTPKEAKISKGLKPLQTGNSDILTIGSTKGSGDILNTYPISGVGLSTGIVWANGLLYILDYGGSRLFSYNPSTNTTSYIANTHSSPYGITWDGTYFWIGNSIGTFYAYNPNGTFANLSFQGPVNSYSGIDYNNGTFYISVLWQTGVFKVDYSGAVLWSATLPSGASGGQIVYVNSHSNGNIWVQGEYGGSIYQIKNDFTSILKTVPNGFSPSSYIYSLAHDGTNLFSASSSQVKEIDDGIVEGWLSGRNQFGTIQPGLTTNIQFDINTLKLGVGKYLGFIVVQSNDQHNSNISIPINLTVTGQPQIIVSQSSIDFGNSLINGISSKTIIIQNNGGDTLRLSSFSSSLPQIDFTIASTKINPGASTNLIINFQPTLSQNYTGLVSFSTNDPDNPTYVISTMGTGSLGSVQFNVINGSTDSPVSNASITFNGVGLGEGNYKANSLTAGNYSYSVVLNGFGPENGNVTVNSLEKVVNVTISPAVVMGNGILTASCNSSFYDPGYIGDYSDNQDMTLTILPSNSNLKVKVQFQTFALENNFDFLYIYDGLNTSAPLLGTFTGSSLPSAFVASNSQGALTFRFYSDVSITNSGWQAILTCFDPNAFPALTFNVVDAISTASISGAIINVEGLGSGNTDINGNYSFGVVTSGSYTYSIIKSGYQERNGVVNYPATGNVSVGLVSWPNISFTIKDQSGNPISNALVNFGSNSQPTNGSGVASFNQVIPLKNYSWSVAKSGYIGISGEQFVGNDNISLSCQLQSDMVDLTVSIVESGSGIPLKDAILTVNGQSYITGADGRLVFPNVPKGTYPIVVTRHAYYQYSGNITVSSSQAEIGLNKITSVSLPYTESFNSEVPSNSSVYDIALSEQVWSFKNTTSAGGVSGELDANWRSGISTVRYLLPPINTIDQNTINLTFRQLFDDYGTGMKVLVETSTDGNNWSPTGWEINSGSGNIGPNLISIDISTNTNSSSTYIAFTLTGNLYQFDDWYVDDVQVTPQGGSLYSASFYAFDNVTSDNISGAQVTLNGYGSLLTNNSGIALFTGIANGTYGYTVSKDGYTNKTGSITINNQNSSQPVGIDPTKAYSLTISVLDEVFNPIQGAFVSITGLPAGVSDFQGKVHWNNVPAGTYNLEISKDGYISLSDIVTVSNSTNVFFRLSQKFFNIGFIVVDASFYPIQNALITVAGVGGVVTDEFGYAQVQGLQSGSYSYTIQKSGFNVYSNNFNIGTTNIEKYITLTSVSPALYSVFFHITDLNGSPIINATVNLTGFGPVNTDANGEVFYSNIPAGTSLSYKITKANYIDSQGMIGLINQNKQLTAVMKPIVIQKYQVAFHVTNTTGTVLAGATIDLSGYTSGITNATGDVTFSNVSFSDQIAYQVTLAGYIPIDGFVNVHGNSSVPVTMALVATTTYSVTFNIQNSVSIPVKNATVFLTGYGSLMTNSLGVAIFNQVAPKNGITYTVSYPPYANLTGAFNLVNTNVVQNLIVNTNVYRAIFMVKDQFNNPNEGISVSVVGMNSTFTNSNGTAIIGGLSPGMYSYNISKVNGVTLNGNFTIADADLPVPITYSKPEYPVTFTVKDESGVAILDANVEFTGYGIKTTNTSGQVLYNQVLPGNSIPYKVSKAGYLQSEGLISVVDVAVEKNVTLISKRHSVQFSVVSGSTAITDAIITFKGVTNPSGNYLFTDVLPGTGYSYTVTCAGYKQATGSISVTDYTTVSVNLNVETFPVTFTVTIPTKSNQSSIPVKILIGGIKDTLTISDNWQATQDLPRGFYNFKAWASGYQTYYGSFEITSAAVAITIRLQIATGIDNITLTAVKAYPNPFTNQITLVNSFVVKQLVITNLIGQRLYEKGYKNQSSIQIETNELLSGVYLLKLIGNDGSTHVIRMIKK